MIKRKSGILLTSIVTLVLLSSCSTESDLPLNTADLNTQETGNTYKFDVNISLNGGGVPATAANTPKSSVSDAKKIVQETPTSDKTTSTPTTTTPESEAPAPKPAASAQDKGKQIMDKIVSQIESANGIDLKISKVEKNLDTGKVVSNVLTLRMKKPEQVRVEVIDHSNASSIGTKLLYNNSDAKVKVRPAGALGFVTTNLDMDDDRLAGSNGYSPASTDVYGMLNRLTKPEYNVELFGKNSSGDYILKFESTGTNELDSRIAYEYIGFDPKTFKFTFWEAYDGSGDDPFFKVNIDKLDYLASVSDSQMKI